LPKCDADQMGILQAGSLPAKLQEVLEPLLKEVESLTEKLKDSDRKIEQIARKDYPETALLQQVAGVGPLIALTFILTVEDKGRFQKSRDIGCHLGLRGKKRAVVAVARKLGILLHRLWVTGEVYEPLRNHNLRQEQKKVAA
jgi:transposase